MSTHRQPPRDARPRPGQPAAGQTRLGRHAERGSLIRADLDAVLAAGFVCHLGWVRAGAPVVTPTLYGVGGDQLYLHGSVASRSLVDSPGTPVCVTVTHVDGVVLARSVFSHSLNYRSAMIFGVPRLVSEPDERLEALRRITEQVAPGQWEYARQPTRKELAATAVLALELDEASVKTRVGPPSDGDGPDAELGVWAGVLPLVTRWGQPEADPLLDPTLLAPPHIAGRAGEVQD